MDFWLLFDMVRGVSARFRRENGEEGDGCAWFACSILELAGKMGGVWSKEENGRSNGGVWCFLEWCSAGEERWGGKEVCGLVSPAS